MTGNAPDQPGIASPTSTTSAAEKAKLLEVAGDWFGDGRAQIRAGILRLRVVTQLKDKTASLAELRGAIADLTNGLARMPASAYGWTALADAYLAAGNRFQAKKDLTVSMLLADDDANLSLWRCQLGLALWPLLNTDDRRLWNNQVNLAWDHQRSGLIDLARRSAAPELLAMELALAVDPARLASFQKSVTGAH